MEWLTDPQAWVALLTLLALEIVLGIDNLVFITILANKVHPERRRFVQRVGLIVAMTGRIALLFALAWLLRLTATLFEVFGNEISGRDVIMILGGLFLLGKATLEIHEKLEGEETEVTREAHASVGSVLAQIVAIDMVFSLDSVLTAIGMAEHIGVMVTAVVVAVLVMMTAIGPISRFVGQRPTVQMLALSFLLLIGTALVGEGFELHIPKGYIYFAMAFSVLVEMLNLRVARRRSEPLTLRRRYTPPGGGEA